MSMGDMHKDLIEARDCFKAGTAATRAAAKDARTGQKRVYGMTGDVIDMAGRESLGISSDSALQTSQGALEALGSAQARSAAAVQYVSGLVGSTSNSHAQDVLVYGGMAARQLAGEILVGDVNVSVTVATVVEDIRFIQAHLATVRELGGVMLAQARMIEEILDAATHAQMQTSDGIEVYIQNTGG
jgi:hypothetical protein